MERIIARDEHGNLIAIGGFSTRARAERWWDSWLGDQSPWTLIGYATQFSAGEVTTRWHDYGATLAVRSSARRRDDLPL